MLDWIRSHKVRSVALAVVALVVLGFGMALAHHISPLSWGWYQPLDVAGGVAVGGYDAVAYHTDGTATEGSSAFVAHWMGAEWRFASDANRALFEADPERYAPQFGGHCAIAVASGSTAASDPEAWLIEDGKLYLFFGDGPRQDFLAARADGIAERAHQAWAAAGN